MSNSIDGLDSRANLALWADDPSEIDLLSFKPVADTVVEALLDDHLDPIALGVSGRWGSGKSTILNFILEELENQNIDKEPKILVISTDPWRYDPSSGVKETLISEVLAALAAEATEHTTSGNGASRLKNLMGRVDWAKALKIAAKTSITFQIPNVNDLLHLLKPPDQKESSGDVIQGLESFRREFKDLMQETNHIRRVVVLVDDLDRCLPPTVVETLEAIRLFLAVPKMSFVIAADEELVANAIRTRYEATALQANQMSDGLDEEPAKLYLHKIVQTTVPVPTLSRFDTEAYIFLLQMLTQHDDDRMKHLIDKCVLLRQQTKELADLPPDDGHETPIGELSLAERLTPILYEKLQGNPRRIKRFLNDLTIRQSIATRRGINLHTGIVAKMMVLEQLLPDEFRTVLDWVAEGVLREQMLILEHITGGIVDIQASDKDGTDTTDSAVIDSESNQGRLDEQDNRIFSDALLRWGKLAPALHDVDLNPYLHLAATFRGELVLTGALPERLRDLAANLCSDVTSKRRSVSDSDLEQLPIGDAKKLLSHLGRLAKDRPGEQKEMVEGILRISRRQPVLVRHTCNVLSSIPADEVRPSSPMLFASKDRELRPVLEGWRAKATKKIVRNAIDKAIKDMN